MTPIMVPSPEIQVEHHLGVLARTGVAPPGLLDALTTIVDAAIELTHAQQGALLLVKSSGNFEVTVARDAQRGSPPLHQVQISSSVLRRVMGSQRELIVTEAEEDSSMARQASIGALGVHSILVIPVDKLPLAEARDTTVRGRRSELLGVLYLHSRWPFFHLDREALRMLARKVAVVVENAALFAALCEKARLDHEVEITGQIQRQMQPVQFPRGPELDVTGFTVECHAVGGDCLDVVKLSDKRHGLLVGDIAGKGIPASLLASLLQGLFVTIGTLDLPPEEVVSRVNRYLCERSPEDWYATLFYAILDSSGRLDYVNAGHVPALIRRCSGKVESLESTNFPVGMFSDAKYTRATTQIEAGNYLLIYTDGIPEAKNRRGEFFGEAGLRRLLEEFPGQTVDDLAEVVRAGVRAFTEGAPQSDDIAVLAGHYRGASLSTTSVRALKGDACLKRSRPKRPLVGRIRATKTELSLSKGTDHGTHNDGTRIERHYGCGHERRDRVGGGKQRVPREDQRAAHGGEKEDRLERG